MIQLGIGSPRKKIRLRFPVLLGMRLHQKSSDAGSGTATLTLSADKILWTVSLPIVLDVSVATTKQQCELHVRFYSIMFTAVVCLFLDVLPKNTWTYTCAYLQNQGAGILNHITKVCLTVVLKMTPMFQST